MGSNLAGSVSERFAVASFAAVGSVSYTFDYLPKEQRGGLNVFFTSDSGFHANILGDNSGAGFRDITSLVAGVATITADGPYFISHYFPWKVRINVTQVGSNVVVATGL